MDHHLESWTNWKTGIILAGRNWQYEFEYLGGSCENHSKKLKVSALVSVFSKITYLYN